MMTYSIHHYPTQLIDVWQTGDGHRVTVRPILPQDAEPSQAFVRRLSRESRRRRFLGALNELAPATLQRLTQVDYRHDLALVAEVIADGAAMLIGEARYARADDGPGAEFALSVADEWQGQGIGARLLGSLLGAARAAGIRHLFGNVLDDNEPMLHLARRAGFRSVPHPDESRLVRVAIDPVAAGPLLEANSPSPTPWLQSAVPQWRTVPQRMQAGLGPGRESA
jgi:acetyltransferase